MRNGGPQCPQAAVWALADGGPRLPSNRRGHGTQEATANDGGVIDNEIITFGRIQQLLAEGGVFVTGGGRINRDHSHFTTEAQLLEALRQAEANSVKRELVRQAALPPRCRMLSVRLSAAVCRMHMSVGCMHVCRCLSVCLSVAWCGEAGSMLHAAGCAA